jgi:putative phage-type endonuclease
MPLTKEQLEFRKKGIGGSEIAAVAGINPWASPADIWASKCGLTEDEKEVTEHMERGIFLEEGILKWAGHRLDLVIQANKETYHSKEHQLVLATPDGLVMGGEREPVFVNAIRKDMGQPPIAKLASPSAIAEVKAPSVGKDWADPEVMPDGVPSYYLPQVVWEMAATNLKEPAVVAAFIGGRLLVYRIPWDKTLEELFKLLVQKAEVFWGYVERQEPPPADGTMAAAKWIKKYYDTQRGVELMKVEPDNSSYQELKAAAIMYEACVRDEKKVKQIKAKSSAVLQQYIKDGAGLQGENFKVTWKQDARGRINYKKFVESLSVDGAVLEEYRAKPPRKFLVRIEKEEDDG